MDKNSQNFQIKQHLERGGSLTALDALKRFGCMRLSGRIYDLTHDHGMNIRSEMVERKGKRVALYSLNNRETCHLAGQLAAAQN